MTPFCSKCGAQQHDDEARFCFSCGRPLTAGIAVPQQQKEIAEEEQEKVLRENMSEDFKDAAKRVYITGRKSTRYRLTNRMLYVEEGVFTTTTHQVPLWAVSNVTVRQEFEQKLSSILRQWMKEEPEDVGDVTVHLEHPDYNGQSTVTLLNVAEPAEVRRIINEALRIERLAYERRRRTHYYGQER